MNKFKRFLISVIHISLKSYYHLKRIRNLKEKASIAIAIFLVMVFVVYALGGNVMESIFGKTEEGFSFMGAWVLASSFVIGAIDMHDGYGG